MFTTVCRHYSNRHSSHMLCGRGVTGSESKKGSWSPCGSVGFQPPSCRLALTQEPDGYNGSGVTLVNQGRGWGGQPQGFPRGQTKN